MSKSDQEKFNRVAETCIDSQSPKSLGEQPFKEIKVPLDGVNKNGGEKQKVTTEVLNKNKNVRQNAPVDSNLLLTKYNKEKIP